MATKSRSVGTAKVSQIDKDAAEFGVGVRCGGWRLGLLVARSVAKGTAGRPKADENHSPENDSAAKVSMNRFAELAGVSVSQVKYHLDAWDLAAKAGLVPTADSINAGDEDVDVEAESIEVEDNPRTHWTFFYQEAKKPASKPEKKEPKVEKEVDEDFGLADSESEFVDSMSETERAEADSSILRNEMLEILESLRATESRLTRIETAPADKADILGQISSVAMDIGTMAMAMVAADEKVETGV